MDQKLEELHKVYDVVSEERDRVMELLEQNQRDIQVMEAQVNKQARRVSDDLNQQDHLIIIITNITQKDDGCLQKDGDERCRYSKRYSCIN